MDYACPTLDGWKDHLDALPRVIDRVDTAAGELVLRQVGQEFEIIANGQFLMDSRNGESERLLVNAALERSWQRTTLLIGGLGVGFSLEAALLTDVGSVTVIEVEPDVIRWATSHFTRLTRLLTDPRLSIVCAEFRRWLEETTGTYDAVCLDVDNGPEWLSRSENSLLYTDTGLARVADRLNPGGTMSIWSAHRSQRLERSLAHVFGRFERLDVPVARGEPDVIYIARRDTRREPARSQ